MKLVSASEFAAAFQITPRAARKVFRNAAEEEAWRGHALPVVALPGNRGGAAGKVWALAVDRCPDEIKAKLTAVEDPLQRAFNGSLTLTQLDIQAERRRIIEPILNAPKHSDERGAAFRTVAAQVHVFKGVPTRLAVTTLRDWVRAFEAAGPAALLPNHRCDKGVMRVQITREWDKGIDLSPEQRATIADRVERRAKGLVAMDGTSIRETLRLAGNRLYDLCHEAGSRLPAAVLRDLCILNKKWAHRIDLARYQLVYLARKDHQLWQDKVVGRTRLDLSKAPMSLLMGDVHYADISAVVMGDEPVRVRLIAWMDMSSQFLWVTPVLLGKGQGVVQADIAESLAHVTMCDHGGIPEHFYLDNGGEYSALSDAMVRLSVLSQDAFGVTLAKPYSPTSKGSIEGLFNTLEQVFKGLPGWIGGRRDYKKTANKGKVVAPYAKGLEQLVEDIQACVAIYNSRPQGVESRLGGLSPKEALELNIEATGYVARMPSEEVFDLMFSRPEVRTVNQSSVKIANRVYHGPCLHRMMPGERIEVFLPLRKDRGYAWVNVRGGQPEQITLSPTFAYGDRAGARYQAALEAASNAAVRELEKDIDSSVSTFEMQKQLADMTPPRANPPELWTGPGVIDKTERLRSPATALEAEAAEEAEARAEMEYFLNSRGLTPQKTGPTAGTAGPGLAT